MGSPHHRVTFSQSYDTDFNERCSQGSTPFASAPSSPGRHCDAGFYFSAPASPHWGYAFAEGMAHNYPSSIPLHWDETPATPHRRSSVKDEAGSFLMASDFEFSARFAELDDPSMPMSSANELFCNGQIKPLKIPTHIEDPSCTTSRIDDPASTFEFHSRGVPSSSISVPHSPSPCFASTFDCVGASTCGIYQGKESRSVGSLSAPQSPISPIDRVKRAFCGVSPSRIDRACDISIHMPIEVSRHVLHSSDRRNKPFDMSLEGSRHSLESSRHAKEGSRRPDSAIALGSQATGTRSEKKHEDDTDHDTDLVPKSLHKKWTLKDLLHRKSGGENRSNSSRLSSSRQSGASMDSTSGRSVSGGRSSNQSSHSGMPSCNRCTHTKEGGSRGRMLESMSNENNVGKKGVKQGVCEAKNRNKGNISKAKSLTSQRGVCVQKGCASPHEMHYMMHKAQSEELRKRTFLPYRQGLLGCLGFTFRSYRTVSSLSKTLQSVSS